MSREINKQLNRQKIVRAAEQIIRQNGVEQLTMRNLSSVADVALKTPYNLFGSKTGVLIALLDEARAGLISDLESSGSGSHLVALLNSLDEIRKFFESDEAFYRAIFWEIMTSDQIEERSLAHTQIFDLVIVRINDASKAGEIFEAVNTEDLGRSLGLNLLALLGMWAGEHLTIAECIEQTKMVWMALVRMAATDEASTQIDLALRGSSAMTKD